MDTKARTTSARALLAILAAIVAVAAVWATTALAGGGSAPAADPATSGDPVASYVQEQQGDGSVATLGEDCPGEGSGGSGSEDGGDGSGGSGTGSSGTNSDGV